MLRALLSVRPEYIAHRMSRSDFVIAERIIFPHPLSNRAQGLVYPWHSSQFSGCRGIVRARGGVAQFTFVMCEPGMAHLKKLIRCPRIYIALGPLPSDRSLFCINRQFAAFISPETFHHRDVPCRGILSEVQVSSDNRNFELTHPPSLSLPRFAGNVCRISN